ncbi:MAG TPA: hypothetical protein VHZ55_11395 [Bryobacteraceae bacterium]|nr:hypothetical protein [Bryobacteraceae bacterium]
MMPLVDKITESQIIIAEDGLKPVIHGFFDRYRATHQSLSIEELQTLRKKEREAIAFVRAQQPPAFTPDDQAVTYLNARCSLYQVALKQYARGIRQWAHVWAAKLAHESRHLKGDHDELSAYTYEVDLLTVYRSAGLLKGAVFDQYIKYVTSGLHDVSSQNRIVLATR